jgi:hypothetical protein
MVESAANGAGFARAAFRFCGRTGTHALTWRVARRGGPRHAVEGFE